MANPEVDKLIQGLSQILERNRQARQTQDAQLAGIRQGMQQGIDTGSSGGSAKMGAALGQAGGAAAKKLGEGDSSIAGAETKQLGGISGDEAAPAVSLEAAGGDKASRVALAQKYAQSQQDPDPTGLGKLSANYRKPNYGQPDLDGMAARQGMKGEASTAVQEQFFRDLAAQQNPAPQGMAAQVVKAGQPNLGPPAAMPQVTQPLLPANPYSNAEQYARLRGQVR